MKKAIAKFLGIMFTGILAVCLMFSIAACGNNDSFEKVDGSAGLVYKLNDDETAYVFSNLGTCTDKNVVIGNWYNGLPVTGVGEGACRDDEGDFKVTVESITVSKGIVDFEFRGLQNWNVKKIILADGIETFGKAMFRKNTEMKVLVIGKGLKTIGQDAFSLITEEQNLKIYFKGSESEWKAVTVETGNDVLSSIQVVYNYTGNGSEL